MFRKRRSQEDFEAEILAHIKLEEDRLVDEGMPRDQARYAARRSFGNRLAAAERFYESRRALWWDHLRHDLRHDLKYAVRTLRRSPGFAAAAVLTLALGIGANTAIFSVIDAALLRPLPYPNAGRLIMLYGFPESGNYGTVSPADFLDYRDQARSFEHLSALSHVQFNLTGQQQPEHVSGAVVTPDLFSTLGVQALVGRTLTPDLDKPGGPRAAVLSRALWVRRYGADPDIPGKTITVDGESITIAGVMPEYFQFPAECDLWVSSPFAVPPHPLNPTKDNSASRDSHYMDVVGELMPGTTPSKATAEINTITARLKQQYPNEEEYVGAAAVALRDDLLGQVRIGSGMLGQTRPALMVLLSAVAVLLLIACVNVANIMLARGATRHKEITIRVALGARRVRIVRQLITESIVLAVIGGCLGVLLAEAAMPLLRNLVPPGLLGSGTLSLDARVLAFTAAISIGSAVLFGLLPALHLASPDLNSVLKEGGRASGSGARAHYMRSALVVSEVAMATVLLIGAGLLIRSFDRLLAVTEGFNADNVLTMRLSLPRSKYPREIDRDTFVKNVLDRTSALPGITSAAAVSRLALTPGRSTRSIDIKGRTPDPGGDPAPDYIVVSPDYFRSMGIQIVRGRAFTEQDNEKAPFVGIVSESAARYFWPGGDPIGKLTQVGAQQGWSPVVGVAADVRQHDLGDPPPLAIYIPYAQDPWSFMSLVVRTSVEPSSAASAIQAAIHSVDSDQPVYGVRTMNDVIAASVSPQRMRMLLIGLFALAAAALASVGIYGVISYSVQQRTSEIGVRMALGAAPTGLVNLIVAQGMKLVALGIGAGLILSLGFGSLMANLLFGVRPRDPLTFAAICALLGLVALAATYIPASRAARIDPIVALRTE
jgi:putative ABC transport system permease protein